VSYFSVVGDAIAFWDFQQTSGNAIDVVGITDLVPAGNVQFGLPGPTSWFPRACGVGYWNAQNAGFVQNPATLLVGLVPYTVAGWVKWSGIALSASFASYGPAGRPNCLINAAGVVQVINDAVNLGSSSLVMVPNVWSFLSWRRDNGGTVRRLGRDGVFESGVTQPLAFTSGQIGMGFIGAEDVVAGFGVWDRYLSDGEVLALLAGPFVGPDFRKVRRGSSAVKAAGRP
jgi:hypothetical protein